MTIMTFVGQSFARKGFCFYFEKNNPTCPPTCNLFATCQANLKPDTVYEVIEVLKRTLPCPKNLHDEDMVLVRVGEPRIEVAMDTRDVFEGATVEYTPVQCEKEECPYYEYCSPNPYAIRPRTKVKVVEIIQKVKDCKKKKTLSIVQVEKK